MRVKVELAPALRRLQREGSFELELTEGVAMRAMLAKVGFKEDEMEHLMIFTNNKSARLDEMLKDGDEIWVGVVIGGG